VGGIGFAFVILFAPLRRKKADEQARKYEGTKARRHEGT